MLIEMKPGNRRYIKYKTNSNYIFKKPIFCQYFTIFQCFLKPFSK